MDKMNWGKAKFEISCLKGEIINGLQRGENLTEIHRNLTQQGKLRAARSTFILHAKKIQDVYELSPSSPNAVEQIKKPVQQHSQPSSLGKKFTHNPIPKNVWDED
ncbi:hypothetical protein [Kiloniella laminariae]|uniref:hypothetical protein n=1 Tax=Kiloniella laminariae TaxID=454162 RepID=UPI000363E6E7|nr:hypothetical protein [Kiloniella laminariae]